MALGVSPRASLWLGFVFSLFCAPIFGLNLAFNVYALPLKETFNFTQAQVEVVASMTTVGLALTFLETICTWVFGYKVTCLVIAIGVPASSSMFALAAYYNHFFSSWPSLVCLIQLVLGIINFNAYLAVTRVCVELFPRKHTGKLVALYLAVSCSGKIYFGGINELFFKGNLVGFFLSVAGVSAVFYGACFTFLYPLATNKELQNELGLESDDGENEPSSATSVSGQEILRSPFFHITFWSSAIFYACGYTSVNNITTIAESVGTVDPLYTVFIMSVIIMVTRLVFGALFDRFLSLWCGCGLIMISLLNFMGGMVICMFFLDTSTIFLTTVLIGIGMATGISTPLAVLLLRFGRKYYSAITGSFCAVTGSCQILLQLMIGFFYDSQIRQRGWTGNTCYGRDCFYWPVFIMLIITVTVSLLHICNFSVAIRNQKRIQKNYDTL